MKKYYEEWREEIIKYLGGKCIKCNSTENLEFDHLKEDDKEFNLAKNWSMKDKDKLKEEIDKCQLLCKNCHSEKTITFLKEKVVRATHGAYRYWNRTKCTCELCLKGRKKHNRKRNLVRNLERKRGGLIRGTYDQSESKCGEVRHYRRGCRCKLCTQANTDCERERRLNKKNGSP